MGWKSKFIFILFIYLAGFSTAIYIMAPEPQNNSFQPKKTSNFDAFQQNNIGRNQKSEEFVQSFNAGLHKGVGFSKEAVEKITKFIKEHIEQRKNGQTGFK